MAAVPVIMSIEQVQEGGMHPMMMPQMMPYCFMPSPEFCEGMWVPSPTAGCEPMWPQSPHGGYNRGFRKGGKQTPGFFLQQPDFSAPAWPLSPVPAGEPVPIELTSLPKALCSKNCLEAVIEQAGLEKDVQSLEVDSGDSGKAILVMSNDQAAQRCIRHFTGLRWGKSATPVSAHYMQNEKTVTEEEKITASTAVVASSSVKLKTIKDKSAKLVKTTSSNASTACSSPVSTCSSPPLKPQSMKPRWSDLADSDSEDDGEETRSGTSDEVHGASDGASDSNNES